MLDSFAPMPKEFARQLLAYEVASGEPADAKIPAAFRVCEKLREPLGRLLGVDGFRSLLSRALALAGTEVPWLRGLKIKGNGSLAGLDELEVKLDLDAIAEGEAVLVGHLVGLLVTFIGPALTLRLLHDIWPEWTVSS